VVPNDLLIALPAAGLLAAVRGTAFMLAPTLLPATRLLTFLRGTARLASTFLAATLLTATRLFTFLRGAARLASTFLAATLLTATRLFTFLRGAARLASTFLAAALLAAALLAAFVASALAPLLAATLLAAATGTFLKATTWRTTSVLAMRLRCFACFFRHVLFSFSFSLRLFLLFHPPKRTGTQPFAALEIDSLRGEGLPSATFLAPSQLCRLLFGLAHPPFQLCPRLPSRDYWSVVRLSP